VGSGRVWSKGASANLQRCCYASLSDPQSLVRPAVEADDGVCGKPTEIGWAGLGGAGLQYIVSSSKNIVCRYPVQRISRSSAPAVSLPGHCCAMPCRAVDSTGIKAEGEGEWNARKHGGSKRRLWRKIHIGIDEETLEIRAIEVTSSSVGDAPMLPDLLNQIPPDQNLGSVTADGAYDTRKCHDAIAARNARAVVPPRKNAKLWKPDTPGAKARNEAVQSSKYLGRALWRQVAGYHRRSRVETKPLGIMLRITLSVSGCIV